MLYREFGGDVSIDGDNAFEDIPDGGKDENFRRLQLQHTFCNIR